MKLTRAECIYLIEKAGMKVKEENISLNAYRDRILYKDERIGTVYYDSVSLSTHYDYKRLLTQLTLIRREEKLQ